MLRNTQLAAIAVAASIIMIGSQADAQGINICNRYKSPHTVTFPRSNSSANRGFTITNSAANAGNKQRQNNSRYGNYRGRQRGVSLNQTNQLNQQDQLNRFGFRGRNSVFVNPPVNRQPQGVAFVPQVPTPAARPRPRLIPNEFIVGLVNGSRFANASSETKTETEDAETEAQASPGQPIGNPFFSVLVTDE
jgi:hypothetical protein